MSPPQNGTAKEQHKNETKGRRNTNRSARRQKKHKKRKLNTALNAGLKRRERDPQGLWRDAQRCLFRITARGARNTQVRKEMVRRAEPSEARPSPASSDDAQ